MYAFFATDEEKRKKHEGNDNIKVYGKDVPFFPVLSHFTSRMMLGVVLRKNNGEFGPPEKEEDFGVGTESGDLRLEQ